MESAFCNRIWKCQWLAFPESLVAKTMARIYTLIIGCTHQGLWRGSCKKQETQRIFSDSGDSCSKIVSPGATVAVPLVAVSTVQFQCYQWYQLPWLCWEQCWYPHQTSSVVWLGYCFCLVSIGSNPCALLFLWFCELLIHSFLFRSAKASLCATKNSN